MSTLLSSLAADDDFPTRFVSDEMNNQDALLVGKPLREIQDDTPVSERAIRDDEDGIDLLPAELLAMILEQVHK